MVPLFQTMVIQIAPPARRGAATATFLLAMDGGISAGSFILGSLAADMGYANLYLSLSLIMFVSLYIYHRIYLVNRDKFRLLRFEHYHDKTLSDNAVVEMTPRENPE